MKTPSPALAAALRDLIPQMTPEERDRERAQLCGYIDATIDRALRRCWEIKARGVDGEVGGIGEGRL